MYNIIEELHRLDLESRKKWCKENGRDCKTCEPNFDCELKISNNAKEEKRKEGE